MKKQTLKHIARLAVTLVVVLATAVVSPAQGPEPDQAKPHYEIEPWTAGTVTDALVQANSGATIPMSSYGVENPQRGGLYTGVVVGGSATSGVPSPVTIDAVVIPVIITVIEGASFATFDPTKPNSCDGGESAEYRFRHSPLVATSNLTFNGVSVGKAQYIDGFMKAEFWELNGHLSSYSNHISWSFASSVSVPPLFGVIVGSGCKTMGVISKADWVLETNFFLSTLQAAGVISPTQFAVFLLNNVVTSGASPATYPANCCTFGRHGATGSPAQTYAWMEYDTAGYFSGVHDIVPASHEIGEWMNDPLGTNPTPAWGNIGQVSGCSSSFEVGDPLSGTEMPVMTLNGYKYHTQELAFFSWFYNSNGVASVGTGGKFSGNGKFGGPSKNCPPGGTH
jgi:hypothetical protein